MTNQKSKTNKLTQKSVSSSEPVHESDEFREMTDEEFIKSTKVTTEGDQQESILPHSEMILEI